MGNAYEYMMAGKPMYLKINNFGRKQILFVAGQADHCCSCTGTSSSYCCECKSGSLDSNCAAELMGKCRLQRLHAYKQYLDLYFGDVESSMREIIDVPEIAHSGCVVQDENVKTSMFKVQNDEITTESIDTTVKTTTRSIQTTSQQEATTTSDSILIKVCTFLLFLSISLIN